MVGSALKLEYKGYKCNGKVLLQILLIAACRDLADAASDDTVLNALYATLLDIAKLEQRLNRALSTELRRRV